MSLEIKHFLLGKYGSFSDRRIKDPNKGNLFIIDDRTQRDIGSDKQLYGYFCQIYAEIESNESVKVSLFGNIPISDGVLDWISSNPCQFQETNYDSKLIFTVTKGSQQLLLTLAENIEAIVKPGKRYDTANYKYVCPRIAKSLKTFEQYLSEFWN